MRLAYFCDGTGDPYARLAALADTLAADGARLAGAVQHNIGGDDDCATRMELRVLGDPGAPVTISQSLGPGSSGCRLDAGALELAVARVAARVEAADLLILSKFGKQEAAGRGFAPVIGQAMTADVPVIVYVGAEYRADFDAFAAGLAEEIAPDSVDDWCRAVLRARAA
ncbi:MAG: DUF2478 domain-containing protein [Paracoccus sp. (in: a-proteobacteria)]|nr:DUF2478 domain-containing protein [Paracoccus sp. (in: a-proteobacteria)]